MLAIIYFTTQHIKSKLPLSTVLYPLSYVHECIVLVNTHNMKLGIFTKSFLLVCHAEVAWALVINSCLCTNRDAMPSTKVVCMHEFIVLTLQILNNWRIEDILAIAKLHVCIALCLCSNVCAPCVFIWKLPWRIVAISHPLKHFIFRQYFLVHKLVISCQLCIQ